MFTQYTEQKSTWQKNTIHHVLKQKTGHLGLTEAWIGFQHRNTEPRLGSRQKTGHLGLTEAWIRFQHRNTEPRLGSRQKTGHLGLTEAWIGFQHRNTEPRLGSRHHAWNTNHNRHKHTARQTKLKPCNHIKQD